MEERAASVVEISVAAFQLGARRAWRLWLDSIFCLWFRGVLDVVAKGDNQAKAPICAAFVAAMREAFGEENVKVIYVKEGEVILGEPSA